MSDTKCHNCGVPEEQFNLEQEFQGGGTIEEFNELHEEKQFCSVGCVIEKLGLY